MLFSLLQNGLQKTLFIIFSDNTLFFGHYLGVAELFMHFNFAIRKTTKFCAIFACK